MPCEYGGVFDISTPELIGLPEDIFIVLNVCRFNVVDEVKSQYLLVLVKHVFGSCRLRCAFLEDQSVGSSQVTLKFILSASS